MIGGIVKKIFLKKSKKEQSQESFVDSFKQKSQQLSKALSDHYSSVKQELVTMHAKCGNLLETNYNLGLKHIENGNISDAIFRFRFIKKFWPDHLDSLYQLSYCLALNKKLQEAKQVAEELLSKDPNHQSGKELLELLNANLNQNS